MILVCFYKLLKCEHSHLVIKLYLPATHSPGNDSRDWKIKWNLPHRLYLDVVSITKVLAHILSKGMCAEVTGGATNAGTFAIDFKYADFAHEPTIHTNFIFSRVITIFFWVMMTKSLGKYQFDF